MKLRFGNRRPKPKHIEHVLSSLEYHCKHWIPLEHPEVVLWWSIAFDPEGAPRAIGFGATQPLASALAWIDVFRPPLCYDRALFQVPLDVPDNWSFGGIPGLTWPPSPRALKRKDSCEK